MTEERNDRRRNFAILLGILTAINAMAVGGSILFHVMYKLMFFENPISDSVIYLNLAWALVLTTPPVVLVGLVGSWGSFYLKRHKTALALCPLPLINVGGAELFLKLASDMNGL